MKFSGIFTIWQNQQISNFYDILKLDNVTLSKFLEYLQIDTEITEIIVW